MQARAHLNLSANRVNVEPKQVPGLTVRRSGRISKEIAVLVSGSDADGRQFSERTKTLVLSRHGASLLSHHKLVPEQEFFLRSLSNNREIEVRVCGEIGEREDGYIYGVAFVDPRVDFWEVEFPPSQNLPISLTPMTLECTGCKARVAVRFDAMEMDVYAVNDGVIRYCRHCLISTVWKRAMGEAVPAKAADPKPEPPPEPKQEVQAAPVVKTPATPPPAAAAIPNRRRERRTKLKCSACIRCSGASEDVVECEDMSRGGFGFRSSRQYPEETMIEVAIPYTPGGTSIFVPARIANVRELQPGKLFRYGAAYLSSGKK